MPEDAEAGYDFETNDSQWNHDQFRDTIVESVRSHDIPYSKLPQNINLQGAIGNISNEVLDTTLKDSEKPEYGTYGKVSTEGKLLISKKFTRGRRDSVTITRQFSVEVIPLAPHYAKEEYGALDIHTHGEIDLPPSPTDILSLLSPVEEGGSQASVIVTPQTRYLLIRSIKTPDMSDPEKQKFVQNYRDRLGTAMRSEAAKYSAHFRQLRIPVTEAMLRKHIASDDTQRAAQLNVLLEVCKENYIGLYMGRANNLYKRKA